MILGDGLSRSPRRRIRRLGATRLPTRPCARGDGRVEVQRDLSRASDPSFSQRHRRGRGLVLWLTHEICVVGVCAESDVSVSCVVHGTACGGDLPKLPI
jgi:hypothetical protein